MQFWHRISVSSMAALIGVWLTGWQAEAQDLYRVRGTLNAVALPDLSVDERDGGPIDVMLTADTGVFVVTPGKLEDIQQDQFVGITSIDAADDQRVALEVHIFADDLRGLGEGHYPWDLASEPTMMTNAAIARIDDGPMLTVAYTETASTKGDTGKTTQGQQQIIIPKDIPVVHFAKADPAMLMPGRDVFLLMTDDDAGKPKLLGIVVGDGIAPPM